MGLCSSSANTASGAVAGRKKALDYYVVTKTLGLGASCKVLMVKDKSSGEKYAMKVMEKKDDNDFLFQNEVSILSVLKHNNIVELHEAFEDERSFNIVSKLCIGGELFDRVTDKAGGFSEKIASQLTKQMLLALKHCHHNDVVHRDLKPENFVFDGPSEDANMKLIDFGCAVKAKDDEIIKDVAGSPYYVAPEVLITYDHQKKPIKRTCKMWKASDMWSIGIIIYLLVHGYPPFNGQKEADIFRKILRGKYKFSSKAKLSSEVKDLIRKLLIKDPFKRLTVDEALSHPWIASNVAPDTALPSFVIKGVEDFRDQCRLKKAVARAMLKHMSDKDQQALEEAFQKWDLNGDGKLSPDEIAQMMKSIGKNAEDAKELMNQIDDDGDGFIDKDEFATLQALEMLEKMNASDQDKFYRDQFRKFDVDGDGEVTHQEIQRVCTNMTPDQVQQLISQVDKNNDGKISFKEWMNAMGNAR